MNPMSSRRYSKAPITEAIIDLRTKAPEGAKVHDLIRCHEGEEETYPHQKDLKMAVGQFEVGPKLETSASSQPTGYLFTSTDQRQIYQARVDGFTMSRLAPYENWERFRNEAQRLWRLYRETVRPTRIERMAVRYINRLDLPG